MLRTAALALTLAALAVVPGCDSGSDAVGLTGTWEGTVEAPAATYDISLQLRDNGRTVTGTGTVQVPNSPFRFTVSGGSFVGSRVELPVLLSESPFNGGLSGTLTQRDPGQIEGTFTGPQMIVGPVRIELVSR